MCTVGGNDCASAEEVPTLNMGMVRTVNVSLEGGNTEAWFKVDMPGSDTFAFRPIFQISGDSGANALIDVYSDCSLTGESCSQEGGNSVGKQSYDSNYQLGGFPPSPKDFQPTPLGASGTAYIRVSLAGNPGCYTLRLESEGDCVSGAVNCDSAPGCETNTNFDDDNCGTCGDVCSTANGMGGCADGTCLVSCLDNFASCDLDQATGCETDLRVTADHCGSCAQDCTALPLENAGCTGGNCTGTCPTLTDDCDNDLNNGCETSLNTLTDCGACGKTCPTGFICNDGRCDCEGSSCLLGGTCVASTGLCICGAEFCGREDVCGSPTTCSATCVAQTCADQGFECGPATDTCGNALACPGCGSSEQCVSNQCIPSCGPSAVQNTTECPAGTPYWCSDTNTCWDSAIDCWSAADCGADGVKDLACACGEQVVCGTTPACLANAERPACTNSVSNTTQCPTAGMDQHCAVNGTCWSGTVNCNSQADCDGNGTPETACPCGQHVDCTRAVGARCVSF